MRLRNNIFAAAFDYLKREKGIKTQKRLAELMGVSEDTITRILKDRCDVSEDIITKLQTASGCIFNLQWLRGEDTKHMLASDLQDEDAQSSSPGISGDLSLIKELVASLKRELDTKDAQIATLQGALQDRDDHIETLKHRCAELQRIIDAHHFGLDSLSFSHGVADAYNDTI